MTPHAWHRPVTGWIRLVPVLGLATACQTGSAPGSSPYPTPVVIESAADLINALNGSLGDFASLGLALVAAQGGVNTDVLARVVRDTRLPEHVRANAAWTLAFMMDEAATRILLELVADSGSFRSLALAVLQLSPHEATCVYWKTLLDDRSQPPPTGRIFAFSGLSHCGTEADIPYLEELARTGGLGMEQTVREYYIPRLRLPVADRYRGTLREGNYPPTGRYRLPAYAQQEVHEALCGGPCLPGAEFGPDAVHKLLRDFAPNTF